MKHITQFSKHITNESYVDKLLDKIKRFGMDSINQKEKAYLDAGGEDETINLDVIEPNTTMSATLNGEEFTFIYRNTTRHPDTILYNGYFVYKGVSSEATIMCVAEDGRFNCIMFNDDNENLDRLGYLVNHFCKEVVVRQLTNSY